MKRRATTTDWLPLSRSAGASAEIPTGEAFRAEWIDFQRGIRVGNLEPHERITRILKHRLEQEYGTGFVTDRWGRGVYWQMIFWIPRADRDAKPVSRTTNFGCAKFFITIDKTQRVFQTGLSVERGFISGRPDVSGIRLQPDWDWHRLMKQCVQGSELEDELRRLVVREGFTAKVGGAAGGVSLTAANFTSVRQVRKAARAAPADQWAGFDLFYPLPESEVRAATGYELVQAVVGSFAEVIPLMNLCMQVSLAPGGGSGIPPGRSPGRRPPASGR